MSQPVNLAEIKRQVTLNLEQYKRRVIICFGTGCIANGSLKIYERFLEELSKRSIEYSDTIKVHNADKNPMLITRSGCQGFCQMGPLVTIEPDGILYTKVKDSDVEEIIEKTIQHGEIIDRLLYLDKKRNSHCKGPHEIDFYKKQTRNILKLCGSIDPENIDEYIYSGGYEAARLVYTQLSPEEVVKRISDSKLRGRGGGGFPTGTKWELCRKQKNAKKFIICNGDEGDPGAFMNRSVLEGNPHSVLEGMMIAGKAIGADEGVVYVRTEYPLAVKRVQIAVEDAMKKGILGNNIFGTNYNFHIRVMEGAGAFVCGEETALMQSVEGKRGMPKPKPPFPAESGLWGYPTVINNVETLAYVPFIINTPEKFTSIGVPATPGTKTFALTGHVVNTGLIEVPFGSTLRQIIFEIGGGVLNNKGEIDESAFKGVQIGGPSGATLTKAHLDYPMDFDSLTKIGAMVGSGGLVVMNSETCMVQIAKYFMTFTQNESCGKCVLCREGTKQMWALLDDITEGKATMDTFALLKQLAQVVKKGSLCGLGKTAPNPVLSTIANFEQEYLDHINKKVCATKQCKHLVKPFIDPAKCKGCTLCSKKCPVGAISGEKKLPHKIDENKCINCGSCIETCKFKAISGGN